MLETMSILLVVSHSTNTSILVPIFINDKQLLGKACVWLLGGERARHVAFIHICAYEHACKQAGTVKK